MCRWSHINALTCPINARWRVYNVYVHLGSFISITQVVIWKYLYLVYNRLHMRLHSNGFSARLKKCYAIKHDNLIERDLFWNRLIDSVYTVVFQRLYK